MSSDAPSRPDSSLAGAAMTGVALIQRRPGLLVAWTLLALLPALALVAAIRWLATVAPYAFPILLFGGAFTFRMIIIMQQCAAYRAVLRPEMGGWGLIRLGAAERRLFLMGFVNGTNGLPIEVFIGLFAGLVAGIGVVAVAASLIGPGAGVTLFGIGWVSFFIAVSIVNVRASLANVAGFVDSPEPRSAGWARGERRTLGMVGNALVVAIFCLPLAALLVGLAWAVSATFLTPSMLLAPGFPIDEAGWLRLVAEGGLLALTVSVLLALFNAVGAPVTAETWRRLGGPDLVQKRRRLFEDA